MVNVGNFDINKQCPQVYIYIFSVLTSLVLVAKHGKAEHVLMTIFSGIITTIWMMGVNYCDWTFQWLTWVMSGVYLLIALTNLILLTKDKEISKD